MWLSSVLPIFCCKTVWVKILDVLSLQISLVHADNAFLTSTTALQRSNPKDLRQIMMNITRKIDLIWGCTKLPSPGRQWLLLTWHSHTIHSTSVLLGHSEQHGDAMPTAQPLHLVGRELKRDSAWLKDVFHCVHPQPPTTPPTPGVHSTVWNTTGQLVGGKCSRQKTHGNRTLPKQGQPLNETTPTVIVL